MTDTKVHTHNDHLTSFDVREEGTSLGGVRAVNFVGTGIAVTVADKVATLTATVPKIVTGATAGPASYATGGFVVDLSATFTDIDFFALAITTVGANLPPCHYEYALNTPTAGKVTCKVMRHRYDRATVGDTSAQNPPSGVTLQGASGAAVAAGSAHTHGNGTLAVGDHAAHTHEQSASTALSVDVGGVGNATRVSVATGDPSAVLTHSVAGALGNESSHTHVDNNLYQHGHVVTQTETNAASVELANATNLSGSAFMYLAAGS